MRLLKLPVDHYKDILTVIRLDNYSNLLEYLDYAGRKTIAVYLIMSVLDNGTLISTQEQVNFYDIFSYVIYRIFNLISDHTLWVQNYLIYIIHFIYELL